MIPARSETRAAAAAERSAVLSVVKVEQPPARAAKAAAAMRISAAAAATGHNAGAHLSDGEEDAGSPSSSAPARARLGADRTAGERKGRRLPTAVGPGRARSVSVSPTKRKRPYKAASVTVRTKLTRLSSLILCDLVLL